MREVKLDQTAAVGGARRFQSTRWSMVLVSAQSHAPGSQEAFAKALKAFLDPINTKRLPSYEETAAQLNVSVGSLKTLIHRLRKRYTAIVREEIACTVANTDDVDAEIHVLREALIAAEGWIMP